MADSNFIICLKELVSDSYVKGEVYITQATPDATSKNPKLQIADDDDQGHALVVIKTSNDPDPFVTCKESGLVIVKVDSSGDPGDSVGTESGSKIAKVGNTGIGIIMYMIVTGGVNYALVRLAAGGGAAQPLWLSYNP